MRGMWAERDEGEGLGSVRVRKGGGWGKAMTMKVWVSKNVVNVVNG